MCDILSIRPLLQHLHGAQRRPRRLRLLLPLHRQREGQGEATEDGPDLPQEAVVKEEDLRKHNFESNKTPPEQLLSLSEQSSFGLFTSGVAAITNCLFCVG